MMRTALRSAVFLLLVGSVHALTGQEPVHISTEELRSHARPSVVREIPALPSGFPHYARVKVLITVDRAGHVASIDADPVYKRRPYWPDMEKRVRGWQFRPFEHDHSTVDVQALEYLRIVHLDSLGPSPR